MIVAGDNRIPIIYKVSIVRDGRSYCTRSVNAQQHGKNIFSCSCSFKIPEDSILEHQYPMPDVPPPEDVPTYLCYIFI